MVQLAQINELPYFLLQEILSNVEDRLSMRLVCQHWCYHLTPLVWRSYPSNTIQEDGEEFHSNLSRYGKHVLEVDQTLSVTQLQQVVKLCPKLRETNVIIHTPEEYEELISLFNSGLTIVSLDLTVCPYIESSSSSTYDDTFVNLKRLSLTLENDEGIPISSDYLPELRGDKVRTLNLEINQLDLSFLRSLNSRFPNLERLSCYGQLDCSSLGVNGEGRPDFSKLKSLDLDWECDEMNPFIMLGCPTTYHNLTDLIISSDSNFESTQLHQFLFQSQWSSLKSLSGPLNEVITSFTTLSSISELTIDFSDPTISSITIPMILTQLINLTKLHLMGTINDVFPKETYSPLRSIILHGQLNLGPQFINWLTNSSNHQLQLLSLLTSSPFNLPSIQSSNLQLPHLLHTKVPNQISLDWVKKVAPNLLTSRVYVPPY